VGKLSADEKMSTDVPCGFSSFVDFVASADVFQTKELVDFVRILAAFSGERFWEAGHDALGNGLRTK
jgi:hypothetical protein